MKKLLAFLLCATLLASATLALAEVNVQSDFSTATPPGIYLDVPDDDEWIYNFYLEYGVKDGNWVVDKGAWIHDPLWTYGSYGTMISTDKATVEFEWGKSYEVTLGYEFLYDVPEDGELAVAFRAFGDGNWYSPGWTNVEDVVGKPAGYSNVYQGVITLDDSNPDVKAAFEGKPAWLQVVGHDIEGMIITEFSVKDAQ